MKRFFLMACVVGLFSACDASDVDNSTVKSVDLDRYLGSWYEIAKFDHSFERGLDYAMARYTLRDDGKIDVLNTGIKDGRAKDAKGIAKTTDVPGFYRFYRIFSLVFIYNQHNIGCNCSPERAAFAAGMILLISATRQFGFFSKSS